MVVDGDAARAASVRQALEACGESVVLAAGDFAGQVQAHQPDVVIIDTDSPDRDTLEHLVCMNRDAPRPVVMFTHDEDPATMRAAFRAGVSAYVVRGLDSARVRSVVGVAMARFEEMQGLRRSLAEAESALLERKRIERAKGIVMRQRRCTEDEAYNALRRLAMDRNRRLAQVAEDVIAMAGLLT